MKSAYSLLSVEIIIANMDSAPTTKRTSLHAMCHKNKYLYIGILSLSNQKFTSTTEALHIKGIPTLNHLTNKQLEATSK